MSKYTTEVRFICEATAGYDMSQEYSKITDVINQSWRNIFDFDFPIYDEEYREVLCKKILMHYYTREIGLETVALWKLKLRTKLNEIMPYYNQLYKSAMLEFNPLYDADYVKEHKGKDSGSGNTQATSNNNSNNWQAYSDTPQGTLRNVQNDTYLTSATKNTGNNTGVTNGSNSYNNTDEYIDHVIGKFPGTSFSKLIMEYRKTMLNIDMEIIDSLSDLFMKLW